MGFFIRKSIRLGPLRFNLSKSGVGVSAGVPGFRLSTGPRGNYVNIGKGGFYYRKTLPSVGSLREKFGKSQAPAQSDAHDGVPTAAHEPMDSITSGDVSRMVDSTSTALLAELERKRQRWRVLPFAMAAAVALLVAMYALGAGFWMIGAAWVVLFCGLVWVYYWDLARRSVVVMYDLDGAVADAYARLHAAIDALARCGAVWHVGAKSTGHDTKYHAGAAALLDRRLVTLGEHDPPQVRTNVPILCLAMSGNALYFCPDTVLIYAPDGIGSLGYDELHLDIAPTRVIEDGNLTSDAKTVDRTWRYTNKDGSPDRRFKDNRELPVCEYEEIRLRSNSGLDELLQVSRVGVGDELAGAIRGMAAALAKARQAEEASASQAAAPMNGARAAAPVPMAPSAASSPVTSVAPSAPVAATPPPLPRTPTKEEEYDALLRILCCVMVVDELASTKEKNLIGDLMRKAGAPWEPVAIQQRIRAFIDEVQTKGFKGVLSESMARVPMFKAAGREDVLLSSLDALIQADGKAADREKLLLAKIRQMLGKAPAPQGANVKT